MPTAVRAAVGEVRPATGPQQRSNTSANTVRPSRFRAWVIPLAVGTVQPASQQPNRSSDPVTFVATSA